MTPPPRPPVRSCLPPLPALALAFALALACLAGVTVATEQPARASTKSLTLTPSNFVGGQLLTWTGNVGHTGVRRLVLQFHMGRVNDAWTTVGGFSSSTRSDGSFSFTYPAPGMFNIKYRVKAGRYTSAATLLHPKTQDLTIRVTGQPANATNEPGAVDEGQEFGITVDTTPDTIFRSPESRGQPVFPGRVLTLQKRLDGDSWQDLGTTTTDTKGLGYFSGLTEPAGTVVYRVREEDVLTDGNQIGWAASFPLYVVVGSSASSTAARPSASARRTSPTAPTVSATPRARSGTKGIAAGPTASQRYRWGGSLWDFAWERGQSLTSPPSRGTKPKGRWLDYADGTGRVSRHNGGLTLDSKRYLGPGPGDVGTTRATVRGTSAKQGRWEARMRVRSASERGAARYKILAELVPAKASAYDCGSHNILIAAINPFSTKVTFGASSPDRRWKGTATASATPYNNGAYAVAVEVTKGHTTWFLNGAPVGSVTQGAAYSGLPMTMRLSLEGKGTSEMNQVSLTSDWQRGWSMRTGRPVVSAKKVTARATSATCGSSAS